MISIALCTYNGAKFLEQQLKSIVEQSVLPNELVVCDDASTDNTFSILEDFAKNAPFKVNLFRNESSLGVVKNFERAVYLCQGDIIFLCDQDDIWLPQKIEKLYHTLQQSPEALLIFTDGYLIDGQNNQLPNTLWESFRFDDEQQKKWTNGNSTEVMLASDRVTGCTVAFRKQLLQYSIPFPTHIPNLIHDGWLGQVACLTNSAIAFPEKLIKYRQHSHQQLGVVRPTAPPKVSFKERFTRPRLQKLAPFIESYHQLKLLSDSLPHNYMPNAHGWNVIRHKLDFLHTRAYMPASRIHRVVPIFTHFINGNYQRFADQEANWAAGFLAAIGDLIE